MRLRIAATLALLAGAMPLRADTKPHRVERLLTLSDSVRVVLSIEGPAPLRAEVPLRPNRNAGDPDGELLLTADADAAWGYAALPANGPVITSLPGARERWQKAYALTPFVPGAPLRATFNPITVVTRNPAVTAFIEIDGKRLPAAVTPTPDGESVTVAWPAVEALVEGPPGDPVIAKRTDVENPPEPPVEPGTDPTAFVRWAAGAAVLGVLAAVVFVLLRARRPKPVPAEEWAIRALTALEADQSPNADRAARVAEILREFVERWSGVPATRLTTPELLAAGEQQGWPVEQANALRELLDEADRAKFAGVVPDDDRFRRLARHAIDWVDDVRRRSGPG